MRRVLIVLLVLALPFLVAGGWFVLQVFGSTDPGKPVTVQIKSSWGLGEVGSELESKGVIGSGLAFQIYGTLKRAGPFDTGEYQIPRDAGIRHALGVLEQGVPRNPDLKLLLPPGLTIQQIAERVGKLPGHTKEKFLAVVESGQVRSQYQPETVTSLEGLLFPDTYFIGAKESDLSIARKLVNRFDEIASRVGLANASRKSPYETIVIASLVQTEAKLAEDAPLIAAVIYNRLDANMPLQIDSTLCYAKGGCPPSPTDADKQLDSPYNTYKIPGLPPTPIASVTEASLRAALNPADVGFLYYVISDENGKHAFATTLEEHNRNVEAARAKGLL
jgi:UPF0755 protein